MNTLKPSNAVPKHEIDANGHQWWTLNNLMHREDGPAVIYVRGSTRWYWHGHIHRTNGAATYEAFSGTKSYYIMGKHYGCMYEWAEAALKWEQPHKTDFSAEEIEQKVQQVLTNDVLN